MGLPDARVQDCHSDADIRSALQAWCAYGEEDKVPADLFKRANPLQRAFAAKEDKLKQDRAVPALGAIEQVPGAAKLDPPIRRPEATSHVGSAAYMQSLLSIYKPLAHKPFSNSKIV